MEEQIASLLATGNPQRAREFLAAWAEHRSSSWADAHREAMTKAASKGHLPQVRGHLRYHLGEGALLKAAKSANIGCIPMSTIQPGSTFMVGRLGKFGLVNLMVKNQSNMPRRSATRKILSRPNDAIDPQHSLILDGKPKNTSVATELAYLGCLVAVPCLNDPTVPAELAIAVSDAGLRRWISWVSLEKMYAILNDMPMITRPRAAPKSQAIPDKVFPRFRLPKRDEDTSDGNESA